MIAMGQDETSWRLGFAAGHAGELPECPPDVENPMAWASGYVQGKMAAREAAQAASGPGAVTPEKLAQCPMGAGEAAP